MPVRSNHVRLITLSIAILVWVGVVSAQRADVREIPDEPIGLTAEEAWAEAATRAPNDAPEGYMIIEEDILVPADFFDGPSPAATYATNLWPDGLVYYEFNANVSALNQQRTLDAMAEWEAAAAVQFIPRTTQPNYIHIQSSGSNSSFVGMIGGRQTLNMFNWSFKYIIAHELAHALGFWHEQSRSDRNSFIQVNTANINPSALHNFNITTSNTVGDYDFDSVMHYGQCAFAICPCPSSCTAITVLPPNQQWQNAIGQRNHLSFWDKQGMAAIYGVPDCNGNDIFDACEFDCGLPGGFCDVPGCGQALDCNGNDIPDDCETDCNTNGVPDDCDIASAASPDCDGNAVPDECDLVSGLYEDCDVNGVPDPCDIASTPGSDCNGGATNCFTARAEPGCDNDVVESCTCAIDGACCTSQWDALCVTTANSCAPCGPGVIGNGTLDICEIPCTGPQDCDDSDACTDGTCGGDGFCDFSLNYDANLFCCDPTTGATTPIDNANPCNVGSCNSSTGEVTQNPLPDGPSPACAQGDPCSDGACVAGACSLTPVVYGDATRDGAVDIFDILCVLDGFAGTFADCTPEAVDIDPCQSNGEIDIFDILAVLDAFSGVDNCCP